MFGYFGNLEIPNFPKTSKKMMYYSNFGNSKIFVPTQKPTQKFGKKFGMQGLSQSFDYLQLTCSLLTQITEIIKVLGFRGKSIETK